MSQICHIVWGLSPHQSSLLLQRCDEAMVSPLGTWRRRNVSSNAVAGKLGGIGSGKEWKGLKGSKGGEKEKRAETKTGKAKEEK